MRERMADEPNSQRATHIAARQDTNNLPPTSSLAQEPAHMQPPVEVEEA